MRIGYISAAALPSRRANSVQVMKMCQALAHQGHRVTLYAPEKVERSEPVASLWRHYGVEPVFQVKWLPAPAPESLRKYVYGLFAAAHCRWQFGANVVYARDLPGALMAALVGLPVIFELHDVPAAFGRSGSTLFAFLLRRRRLQRVVVTSHALKTHLGQTWPQLLEGLDVVVAANGVDLERFRNLPSTIKARATVGLDDSETFVAGYAGHLYPGRGVDLILKLASSLPNVRFLVIGGNPPEVRSVRGQISHAELANVTLTGFVANEQLPLYLAACDVLLMPYQRRVEVASGRNTASWMNPLKMFEYMAASRAILASDLPVLREVLNDDNAILLDPEDVSAWRAALERAIREPEWRERFAWQAQRDVSSYSWRHRAERCLSGSSELPATSWDRGRAG